MRAEERRYYELRAPEYACGTGFLTQDLYGDVLHAGEWFVVVAAE